MAEAMKPLVGVMPCREGADFATSLSINDGFFCVDMAGMADAAATVVGGFPASYHGGGGGLSFADGHSELHKWRDAETIPPIVSTGKAFGVHDPNNVDMAWLMPRSTARE